VEIDDMTSSRFFYHLLEKITTIEMMRNQKNEQHYVNLVLEHLLPDLNEQKSLNNRVKMMLLGQFLSPISLNDRFEERELMFCNEDYRTRFERKLRLFLLFSDRRYPLTLNIRRGKERKIKSAILSKPQRYLYKNFFDNEMGSVFVKQESYEEKRTYYDKKAKKNKERNETFIYYPQVPIKTSMFYRLKKFLENNLIEKSALAIEHVTNGVEAVEMDKIVIKEDGKTPRNYRLKFNKSKFEKLASNPENWNEATIDSLMIFYKYIDVLHHWRERK